MPKPNLVMTLIVSIQFMLFFYWLPRINSNVLKSYAFRTLNGKICFFFSKSVNVHEQWLYRCECARAFSAVFFSQLNSILICNATVWQQPICFLTFYSISLKHPLNFLFTFIFQIFIFIYKVRFFLNYYFFYYFDD